MSNTLTSTQRMQLQMNLRDVLKTNNAVKPVHPVRNPIKSENRRNIYVPKEKLK